MPQDLTDPSAPDWAAIEAGNMLVVADSMWLLYALIKQEAQIRDQAVRDRAEPVRQDRIAMMGVYSG